MEAATLEGDGMAGPDGITVEEVKKRIEDGESVFFLDSRSDEAWRHSAWQIPDGERVPPDEIDSYLDEIPRRGLVVAYCTCPRDESARHVAATLQQHGVTTARPLIGGLDAWLAAGGPSVAKPAHTLKPMEVSENIWNAESGAEADADQSPRG